MVGWPEGVVLTSLGNIPEGVGEEKDGLTVGQIGDEQLGMNRRQRDFTMKGEERFVRGVLGASASLRRLPSISFLLAGTWNARALPRLLEATTRDP
jgi:hypothetical protein